LQSCKNAKTRCHFISIILTKINFLSSDECDTISHRALHRFGHTKFAYVGLILGLSQFSLLPQLPLKMVLDLKVVKIEK
jgi:hypothetical protein